MLGKDSISIAENTDGVHGLLTFRHKLKDLYEMLDQSSKNGCDRCAILAVLIPDQLDPRFPKSPVRLGRPLDNPNCFWQKYGMGRIRISPADVFDGGSNRNEPQLFLCIQISTGYGKQILRIVLGKARH